MKRIKWVIALNGQLFYALSLISCKNMGEYTAATQETEKEKITLRFISSWGGVDSKAETLQELFVQFTNENKHIEIINESLFGEDFLPKIKTDFASGNNPDVFGLWPGSDIRALIRAGKVADITELMENNPEWKASFKSSMLQYTTYNDKIYGLPFETIFEALFINKDLFEKYQAPIPETYEDLKKAVTIFRKNGIVPIAYNSFSEGTYLYQNMVAALAGKEIAENPSHPQYGDYYQKAMEYMRELYQMKAFHEEAFTMTNDERNTLFRQKKAAMIVQGSWFIGDFKNNDETVDVIHFPSFSDGKAPPRTMVHGLGNGCFYISSETYQKPEQREAAVQLLKMLTSKETAATFARQTGMISSVDIRDAKIDYRATERSCF